VRVVKAVHGGDMHALGSRLGRDPASLLDFSANVNPLGPPDGVRAALRALATDPAEIERYPDPRYVALRNAFATRHGVDADRIVVANGSAALVGAALRALDPKRCVVSVPAFSEYAKGLHDARVEPIEVPVDPVTFAVDDAALVRAAETSGATACLLSNPNNPTGVLTPRATIVALAAALHALGRTLIVDEAFVDYVPHASCVDDAAGAIVLRSLTKFYAMPGIRIGYAVAPGALAERVADALPSWPVGAIEQRVALAAIADAGYDARTRAINAAERERVRDRLANLGYRISSSAANFLLVDVTCCGTTADRFADDLASRFGIAVRACDDYHGLPARTFVRVAIRSRADDDRLLVAFAALRGV